ncbi:hypothetical protein Tco_0211948 [Tanacetum coccineum]
MDGSVPTKEPAFIADGTGYKVKRFDFSKMALEAEVVVAKVDVVVAMVGEEVPWPEEVEVDLSNNTCGEVGGVEKISSTGSNFIVKGEECLEGCVGVGEVREVVERHLELMDDPFDSRLEVIDFGMVEMLDEGC